MAIKRIYRPREVDELFGWSASTRKRKVKNGEMKPPLELGPNMRGWEEEYLLELRQEIIAQRDEDAAE